MDKMAITPEKLIPETYWAMDHMPSPEVEQCDLSEEKFFTVSQFVGAMETYSDLLRSYRGASLVWVQTDDGVRRKIAARRLMIWLNKKISAWEDAIGKLKWDL